MNDNMNDNDDLMRSNETMLPSDGSNASNRGTGEPRKEFNGIPVFLSVIAIIASGVLGGYLKYSIAGATAAGVAIILGIIVAIVPTFHAWEPGESVMGGLLVLKVGWVKTVIAIEFLSVLCLIASLVL